MVLMLAAFTVGTVALSAMAYGLGALLGPRGDLFRERVGARLRRQPPVQPGGRPIQLIAAGLPATGIRYHGLDPHASSAKVVAVQGAYDRTSAECCNALG